MKEKGTVMNGTQGALYDANGNLTQRSDNLLSTSFTYDNLERLDTALGIFGARDYNFDKNGNRSQLQIGATATRNQGQNTDFANIHGKRGQSQ